MSKYRIMIIDDDDDARRLLNMALRARYEIVEACDGLDALSKLETYEPDFAIIDIMMPLMDGYQVCEAIRRHPRFKTMQVMFLSAFGSKENIKKSYAVGANLFMTKPVDPERVLKNIDFTIQHEPPPLRVKKYTVEQLEKLDVSTQRPNTGSQQARPATQPQAGAAGSQAAPPPQARPHQPPRTGMPRAPQQQVPVNGEERTIAELFGGIKPRVLVVDDDPEMLQMVDLAIRDDYEVTMASNGLEAIEHMVDYEPDLMLMDIMMPKMNGYQLLQSIRRNAYFKNLPVIVISAKSTPRDKEYAARLGATDFVAKPYHIDELHRSLRKVLTAPGFKLGHKTLSIHDIREKVQQEAKLRQERVQQQHQRPINPAS